MTKYFLSFSILLLLFAASACGDDAAGTGVSTIPTETSNTSDGTGGGETNANTSTSGDSCDPQTAPCPNGDLCVEGECVPPCTQDTCPSDQLCDPSSQLCVPPCDSIEDCDTGQGCDLTTQLCVPEECAPEGNSCAEGESCIQGTCQPERVRALGGFCAGCERVSSQRYKATISLSPLETVGPPASSSQHRLQSGTVYIQDDAN